MLRRSHSLIPSLPRLAHRRPFLQPLVPRPRLWVRLLPLLQEVLAHNVGLLEQQPVPRHERQVRVRGLIADEVLLACLLEVAVDDADHAADLVAVAVETGG